jgi:hypothetical protein
MAEETPLGLRAHISALTILKKRWCAAEESPFISFHDILLVLSRTLSTLIRAVSSVFCFSDMV